MISRTTVRAVLEQVPLGADVTVFGWVRNSRTSSSVAFASISDGSCFAALQIVFDRARFSDEALSGVAVGSCIRVSGRVESSKGQGQARELMADSLDVAGPSGGDYPLQPKRHSMEFLRTLPQLRARTATFNAVFRIRHRLAMAVHDFFDSRGFVYVHPPLLTSSDCEGAGETFQVTTLPLDRVPIRDGSVDYTEDFFGRKAYLTVSAQLEAEPLALGLGSVYTFGPIFRADPSDTRIHAAEFWMIEPEMAFFDLDDDIALIEEFVKHMASVVRERCRSELAFLAEFVEPGLEKRYSAVLDEPFARVAYTEAVRIIGSAGADRVAGLEWGRPFSAEQERFLADEAFGRPVFVTDYPASFKPFYMRMNDDGRTVACTDLLVPGVGEIVGGSQREERLDAVVGRAREQGMDMDTYSWYFDIRRWGSAPHSGFGLGFERMLMYLTGMKNIRDVIPYPRTFGSMA
ncbi:asparagine--tRNA ligase [Candidatus Fermentibacteria bacterium]|nr:asparagine--tRNA ligase [Candidatus Fermentibacteria bacterium]